MSKQTRKSRIKQQEKRRVREEQNKIKKQQLYSEINHLNMEILQLDFKFPLLKSLKQDKVIENKLEQFKKPGWMLLGLTLFQLIVPLLIFKNVDIASQPTFLATYAILVAICMPIIQNIMNNLNKKNENKKIELFLEIIAYKLIHKDTNQEELNMYKDAISIAKYSHDSKTSWDYEYELKKNELIKVLEEKQKELDKLK